MRSVCTTARDGLLAPYCKCGRYGATCEHIVGLYDVAVQSSDLLKGFEFALEQLGVRELGVGETLRHVLEVRGILWVRPSAAHPDLRAFQVRGWTGVLCTISQEYEKV